MNRAGCSGSSGQPRRVFNIALVECMLIRLLRLTRAAPVQISLPKCSWQDSAEKCHKQYLMSLLLFAFEPCRIAHRYPRLQKIRFAAKPCRRQLRGVAWRSAVFCLFDDTARRVRGLSKEAARRFPRGCKDILASAGTVIQQ